MAEEHGQFLCVTLSIISGDILAFEKDERSLERSPGAHRAGRESQQKKHLQRKQEFWKVWLQGRRILRVSLYRFKAEISKNHNPRGKTPRWLLKLRLEFGTL